MRKCLFLIISFLIVSSIQGQNCKLSLGVGGVFERYLHSIKDSPITNFDHLLENVNESSLGLNFNLGIFENSGFKGGIFFSQKNFRLKYQWIFITPGPITNPDPLIPSHTNFKISYIDIPICYYNSLIQSEKSQTGFSLGVQNRFVLKENIETFLGTGDISDQEVSNFNDGNFDAFLRIGLFVNKFVGEKAYFSLEPNFLYQLNKEKNTDFDKNKLSVAALLSLNYCLF